MNVRTLCHNLLEDANSFRAALQQFVDGKQAHTLQKEQSVAGLILLIDFVLEMLRDCGLHKLHGVYTAIKNKTEPRFELEKELQVCALSALPSHRCLRINESLAVDAQYRKWIWSAWLVTHMQELEQQRRRCKEIAPADAELYRTALSCVLEQFELVYATVCDRAPKTMHESI